MNLPQHLTVTCVAAGLTALLFGAMSDPFAHSQPLDDDRCQAPYSHYESGDLISGEVVYVGDGDSICVAPSSGSPPHLRVEIRIEDFRALELSQKGGWNSRYEMERIALGRKVLCVATPSQADPTTVISYDRVVARCYLNRRSLGDLMRAAGVPEGGR